MEGFKTHREIPYWLALMRAPVSRVRILHDLLSEFESPGRIFNCSREHLLNSGIQHKLLDYLEHPDWDGVADDLDWLQSPVNHFITFFDSDYPDLLKEIYDPPLALFVAGDRSVLKSCQISIVGSRRPTVDGKRNARDFAAGLARLGVTITSGMATGLDSEAHQGALDENGRTIAVLGSGLKCIYPPGNKRLAQRIKENGAIISEFPPERQPVPMNFPRRNRIISGLSTGTLVVEAALKSGTLITAGYALEQGREVFAIPGSIHNQLARGCNGLIRQGAKLVQNIDDILEEIGPLRHLTGNSGQDYSRDGKKIKGLDECSILLLDYIGSRPVSIDFLVAETRFTASEILVELMKMELAGIVQSLPGGNFVRY